MALSSSSGFAQWAYGIGRSRHDRHGRTDIQRGSSVRSGGSVSTMLLCSANDISAICSIPIKNITMRPVRTYRCTRTRRSRVPFRPSVARWRCRFWADCTINILERRFPTGTTRESVRPKQRHAPTSAFTNGPQPGHRQADFPQSPACPVVMIGRPAPPFRPRRGLCLPTHRAPIPLPG